MTPRPDPTAALGEGRGLGVGQGFDEFDRAGGRFDGDSYLYLHPDVRRELGCDPEGAYRHWWFRGHAEDRYPPGLPRRRPRRFDPARFAARPFGITVWGPFEAVSGLGTAARNLAEAIRRSGIAHEFRPYDVESGHARLADPADGARPTRFRVNFVLANADQIRHVASLHDEATFDDAYTIAVWAWELAAFRPDWHAAAALVDEVWTNSRFELASLASSSIPVPLHLMPLPVPLRDGSAEARSRGRRLFGIGTDAFAVLCPFDPGSTEARKNPRAAIGAFRDTFGTDERRVLLVKQHGGSASLRDALLRETGAQSNIRLIGARLSDAEMALLQAASDVVVSPHRSEGFGLNIAEMLAAGRTAVATDYAGSRDFLDAETGFPVRCRLVPVGHRAGPYLEDAVWAEPDRDDLRRQLAASADPAARSRRAAAGRARIAASFSPEAIGARIASRLRALGLDRAPETGVPHLPFARHADASLARFVPAPDVAVPDVAAPRVRFPARLPLFSVAVDADRPDLDLLLAAFRAQTYPFWEVLLHRAAPWPAPEDAAGRDALRPFGDLRIRLVGRAPGAAGPSPDAASGVPLGLPPMQAGPPGPGWLLDTAGRFTGRSDADEADRVPPPGASVSIRATSETIRAAAGHPSHDGALDSAVVPATGFRALAARILRGDSAEHVVILSGRPVRFEKTGNFEEPDWLSPLLAQGWTADTGAVAGTVSGVPGCPVLVTTRTVLRRIASLAPDFVLDVAAEDGPEAAFRRLGLAIRAVPLGGRGAAAADGLAEVAACHRDLVRRSGLFDDEHYAKIAPDVAASGADLVGHYCDRGWRENRAPNFYFDPLWYRRRYLDAAGQGPAEQERGDPLIHWMRHRRSGVRPSPLFDPAFVRWTLHLDPERDPLAVFLERRRDQDIAPVPGFDPAYYRRMRRDMAYRRSDPFEHYVRHGAREGANPASWFDTAFYRSRHMPGGLGARLNPLIHWIENRDRPGVVTSAADALRTRIRSERAAGRDAIDVDFAWYDGLPQGIETLRALLAAPELDALPFRLVLRNEALASRPGLAPRVAALIRSPYEETDEDEDLCQRLAECLADRRALRDASGAHVLAVAGGRETGRALAWAARVCRRLGDRHGLPVVSIGIGIGSGPHG